MFKSSDKLTELVNDNRIIKIGDIASCVTGFYSGNDKDYLHTNKWISKKRQKLHNSKTAIQFILNHSQKKRNKMELILKNASFQFSRVATQNT